MDRAFIFDLDGTLAETRDDIAASANHALAAVGLPTLPVDVITTYVGEGAAKLIERCVSSRQDLFAPTLQHWTAHYNDHLLDATRLYPGVADTLATLPGPLAVLSNKPEAMSRTILAGLGIGDRFRLILGGDSLPVKKPDPSGIRRILEACRCDTGVLVGDTPIDVQTARAAGIPCWGAAYGFTGRAALAKAGADRIFERFEELKEMA